MKINGEFARVEVKKNNKPTAATPIGKSFTTILFPPSLASARSRFQPQRAQNGLLAGLKERRSGTWEPQRGHMMLLILFILDEPLALPSDSLGQIALFKNSFEFLESCRFLL